MGRSRHRHTRCARAARRGLAGLVAATALCTGVAPAEGLGEARQLSRVGEPLLVSIAVTPEGAAALDPACLGVVGSGSGDGLPHILTARVALDRGSGTPSVVVSTAAPLAEPAARLLLRADCAGTTRLYTLFLEPPGSTRVIRVPGQAGPSTTTSARRDASAPSGPSAGARSLGPPIAKVAPGAATPAPGGESAAALAAAALPPSAAPGADPATLEAENRLLKRRVVELNGELERLQHDSPVVRPAGASAVASDASSPSGRDARAADLAVSQHWDVGLLAIALGGLAALTTGGFMWQRRRAQEWSLTGPPSHRLASRTRLGEEPVAFRPSLPRAELGPSRPAIPPQVERRRRRIVSGAPASLLLQPSAEDLARELEEELEAAARSHSSLERCHPDLVDKLTRNWGTASARAELASLLAPDTRDGARMSGESVAELQLLQRIAEDLARRPVPLHVPALGPAAVHRA